ncbi:Eukaryotic and archaeal DNA primase large subunit family protein [Theileria parva strain Muguga]|uniref:Eukaryotic and archaeal DNA primase large subunit family protein n=1 Tax=Theileria parva strain Muguga TaxID=333668 RepID=UPI001C61A56D|nr:Eukaryotic and archaeal DNA primase large subunit family protein [Theileria parva strain Muguga]EAN31161.2 Eukaryotic and archaeal DNA primase large subunit family protein [Theileria parva strain Muguga]
MKLVAIKNSIAYVPPNSLFIVISTKFRNELQHSMKYLNENQSMLDSVIVNDERLCDFMRVLPESYLANDYSKITFTDDTRLTLSNINQVYKFTFPPCMRRMFSHLLKNHHIKHEGRQQLWLFLKGCGLTMEESLQLNRTLWNDSGNFDKEHAYNIRHLYGKEGKRTSYPPYSCTRMIKNSPPNVSGTAHGCPFKELDPKSLYQLLQEFGLNSTQIEPIIDLKTSFQFQLACVEYFNQTTPNACADGIGTSPNTFFHSSFKAKFLKNNYNSSDSSSVTAKATPAPTAPTVTGPAVKPRPVTSSTTTPVATPKVAPSGRPVTLNISGNASTEDFDYTLDHNRNIKIYTAKGSSVFYQIIKTSGNCGSGCLGFETRLHHRPDHL